MASYPAAIPNPVYSTFAFLGFVASAIPLKWHLEGWRTGSCLYMIWSGIGCLNLFINSIIWRGNIENWAPVWCDISSRIILGTHYAIPAASLCINRRLYYIISASGGASVSGSSRSAKRRAVMIELGIGMGYPLLMIALQYIVQGHRFDIFGDIGCYPTTYNTPPAFILVHCQPLLIGTISGCYCILNIRHLIRRHLELKDLFSGYQSLNPSRYLRLLILAGTDVVLTIPLSAWVTAVSVRNGIYPWISWEDTHFGFSRVDQIPAYYWRRNPEAAASLEFTRWSPVLCALVFFAFFGVADEARVHYRSAISKVVSGVGSFTSTITGSPRKGDGMRFGSSRHQNASKGSARLNGMVHILRPIHARRADPHSTLDELKSTLTDSELEGGKSVALGQETLIGSLDHDHESKVIVTSTPSTPSRGDDAAVPQSPPPPFSSLPQGFYVPGDKTSSSAV